jgi:hypothetical protein
MCPRRKQMPPENRFCANENFITIGCAIVCSIAFDQCSGIEIHYK